MGIERFFSSLNRQFDVVTDLYEPYTRIDATHFLIDFNSIIHNVSSEMLSDINKYKQGKITSLNFPFNKIEDFEPQLILQVKEAIKNLLKNNFISNNVKYVMLAIDGVPSFAKMMEQKKRRYIGDLLTKLMSKYELPIEWSKNNISPGTKFMDDMCKKLKENSFIDECKEICSNLSGILVSDVYNPGEGEMKIMTCLRGLTRTSNKVCVYSPDSDMILLLMILDIPTTLLRFDQQKSKNEDKKIFNLIDVNKFKSELVDYCKSRIDMITDDRLLIDEIIYIFTLFGDDFLPKLESINVGEDINSIMDNYLLTLKEVGHILLKDEENNYKINDNNLKHFFKLLTKYEIIDINRNFYNSKYKNYIYAKKDNFHLDLSVFKASVTNIITKFVVKSISLKRTKESVCTPLNAATCIDVGYFYDFFKSILDKSYDYNTEVKKFNGKEYSLSKTDLNQDIYAGLLKNIKDGTTSDKPYYNFTYNISKIIDGHDLYNILYGDGVLGSTLIGKRDEKFKEMVNKYKSLYYLKLTPEQLIEELVLYLYLQPLQFPFINFTLEVPDRPNNLLSRTFKLNKEHNSKMKKQGLLDKGKEREKEQYMIDFKIEHYEKLFNPQHSFYSSKVTSLTNYYNKFFPGEDKQKIVNNYIQGFDWVLNYYFNNKVDTLWYYPYGRTPLLSDIVNLYPSVKLKLNFDENRIFNPLESIIFISPIESGDPLSFFPALVTKETKDLIERFMSNNRHFFLPLSEINTNLAKDITSLPDLLDCSISIFLSKCHYKLLEKNTNPELFMKKFREIIPLEQQQLKNNITFKCVKLGLQ